MSTKVDLPDIHARKWTVIRYECGVGMNVEGPEKKVPIPEEHIGGL